MSGNKVRTVNLADLAKELNVVTDAHLSNLKAATGQGVASSIPMLVQKSPIDTGLYAQSWDFTADERKVVLGNYAPHAPIIEHGARPFKPPIGPLLAWAKRVLQDPSQPPDYSENVWKLAVGTQQKIMREGMKPQKIMENAIPSIIENIKKEYLRLGTK